MYVNKKRPLRIIYLESIGLNPIDYDEWNKCFLSLKHGGRLCNLTFEQYIKLATEAGLTNPSQIGKNIDSYQMGRLGDSGSYELGNCRFITMRQNLDERKSNGGNNSISNSMKGRTKDNTPYIAKLAEEKTGKTKENDAGHMTQSFKISKSFVLIDPAGTEHKGRNLREFCIINGLNIGNMGSVCRGDRTHAKGWTGSYTQD